MQIPEFPFSVLESVCNIFGETNTGLTGSEIGRYLSACGIDDVEQTLTKRFRLYEALKARQLQDKSGNHVAAFIQAVMNPARYTASRSYFEDKRAELNQVLGFAGFELNQAGQLQQIERVNTLAEAAQRADRLRYLLGERNIHPDVLSCCREELLVENYFHAVLEATKSVAEKIRQRTGLTSDGSELIDAAFSFKNHVPYLALNSLITDSEKSEQSGFMNLLKGLFGTFRNPTAHSPRVAWVVEEQDALDILSLISLVHRKLDNAIEARRLSSSV